MEYKYKIGVSGGTFDSLHRGHKYFLLTALSLAEKVYVTITSDKYTSLFKPNASSFTLRKEKIKNFLKKESLTNRSKIVGIDDVYGITLKKNIAFDVLFVTKDSIGGAKKINKKRQEYGLKPLKIEIIQLVKSEIGIPISSTNIKKGMFDKNGKVFLPQNLREKLHQPFGKVYKEININVFKNFKKIISVGDVTTKVLNSKGINPYISIIDFVVERKKQNNSLEDLGFKGNEKIFHVINPAGSITKSLWEAIANSLSSKKGQ